MNFPDRTISPEVHPLRGMRLPDVRRTVLANGVRGVWLDHGQQPVNRITVTWPVGTADTGSPEAMRLLRMMLTEGTRSFTGEQIAELLEYNGAWIKAEGGRHMTSITLHSLNKTLCDILPPVLEMIGDIRLSPDKFMRIREKEAAACELKRKKVVSKAAELASRLYFGPEHPLAHAETAESIRAVTPEQVEELHSRIMASSAPVIYVAGRIDERMSGIVEDAFSGLDFGPDGRACVCRCVIPARQHAEGVRECEHDAGSMQTAIKMIFPTIDRHHADYESLRYTVFALGGYFGSRLMSNIREEKGYTYGINATLASQEEGASVSVTCQCDNRYAGRVLEEIEKEMLRLSSEPLPPEELEIVRNTVMSGLTSLLDSPFSIMDYYSLLDMYGQSKDYYRYQLEELSGLTSEKIMQCAGDYLQHSPRLVALAGNPEF